MTYFLTLPHKGHNSKDKNRHRVYQTLMAEKRVYVKRRKPSRKFDHNFNELYVDSDKRNNFQCIG